MKFLSPLVIVLFASQVLFSQSEEERTSIQLQSQYFPNQERTIKVYLPTDYDDSKSYPVIYTLDGTTLFDIAANYVAQLSKTTIAEDGYDFATDAIPKSIVIGIFHNDRYYETTPNASKLPDTDETIYTEGSEHLKHFIFKELIPFIDKKYSTSGYNAIIGHSNTAHFVMCLPFQNHNPFTGLVSLSLGGYSKQFKAKIKAHLEANTNQTIFIGYGTKDFEFNEVAQYLEKEVKSEHLKVAKFNANHNEMPALGMLQALKFLFKHYRNIDDFSLRSKDTNFDIKAYIDDYSKKNKEAYGIVTTLKEDDYYSLIQMSIKAKNKTVFNQLMDYETKVNGSPQQTHMLFVYNMQIGDFTKAEQFASDLLHSEDNLDQRILKGNLDMYYNFFINDLKDVNKAIAFFEKGKQKFKDSQLEFSFFIAKACLENGFRPSLAEKNYKYCLIHFKDNRYFRKQDLEALK
jgi:predicted alpha/beta superfamily hydrolase